MREEKIYLYGKHALREALLGNPRAIRKVFLDGNAQTDVELTKRLKEHAISWNPMKEERGKVKSDAVHQGVIAELNSEALYTNLESVLSQSRAGNPCFVVLDELQDPHNVGAIIRSAAAFGASAILLPEHNQAPVTGAVIKSSAGMALRMPLVRVGNVNQALRALKDAGFWIYGLAMEGDTKLRDAKFDTPVVFVVGNESEGIRQKTLELCDIVLSIPMDQRCESLNAAAATSVVLYEWSRSRL
jgi:23S rRNA (guanosine2251-2'-O)-methyltransferase